jgi:hypothetical protein
MIEMTNKKYLIGKIVPKSNRKMVETEIKMIPPALIHGRRLSWLGTGTSIV